VVKREALLFCSFHAFPANPLANATMRLQLRGIASEVLSGIKGSV
jgi:hypothetical protein